MVWLGMTEPQPPNALITGLATMPVPNGDSVPCVKVTLTVVDGTMAIDVANVKVNNEFTALVYVLLKRKVAAVIESARVRAVVESKWPPSSKPQVLNVYDPDFGNEVTAIICVEWAVAAVVTVSVSLVSSHETELMTTAAAAAVAALIPVGAAGNEPFHPGR